MKKLKQNVDSKNAVKRLWGDTPVIDGQVELRVMILPQDVACATRKDPGCCVFAQACKRQYGSTKVLFLRSVAYVELPDENGNIRVERFKMSRDMRSLIEQFDRGEDTIPKAGFRLIPVDTSKRFDAPKSVDSEGLTRSQKTQKARRLLLKGIRDGDKYVPHQKPPIVIDMSVRHGSGLVHFRATKTAPVPKLKITKKKS